MLHVDQLLSEGTRLLELMEVPHSSLKENLDYQNSIVRTKQLVHQIREIKAKIEFMWSVRCSKLANNFRFRKFEEDMQSVSDCPLAYTSNIQQYNVVINIHIAH